jgi:hypothetical protein
VRPKPAKYRTTGSATITLQMHTALHMHTGIPSYDGIKYQECYG